MMRIAANLAGENLAKFCRRAAVERARAVIEGSAGGRTR